MAASRINLECPNCQSKFEARPPDRLHSAYSFEKPLKGKFTGGVITQNLVCRNPKCRKPITIYWNPPMDFFNRI